MTFSEKVGTFYQSACNSLHNFAIGAKDVCIKAGTYISETAVKIYNAVLPHFERFKEAALTYIRENKTSIGLVAIGLGIGAAIGSAIACLCKGKPKEVLAVPPPSTLTPTPSVVNRAPINPPAGGVEVLPPLTPVNLKSTKTPVPVQQPQPQTPVPVQQPQPQTPIPTSGSLAGDQRRTLATA